MELDTEFKIGDIAYPIKKITVDVREHCDKCNATGDLIFHRGEEIKKIDCDQCNGNGFNILQTTNEYWIMDDLFCGEKITGIICKNIYRELSANGEELKFVQNEDLSIYPTYLINNPFPFKMISNDHLSGCYYYYNEFAEANIFRSKDDAISECNNRNSHIVSININELKEKEGWGYYIYKDKK